MYQNKSNPARNRLYVTFKGKIDVAEMTLGAKDVINYASKLKPGFGVISDVSEFIPATEEVRLIMQNTMKQLKELGMNKVVRIVPDNALVAGNQWQRTSRAAGYSAEQAPTAADAEVLLDKLEKGG